MEAFGSELERRKRVLTIPLTAGRITFLRHATQQHTVKIAGINWPVPPTIPTGGLVTATITTHDKTLTIRHQGQDAVTYPYPIKHPITDPYYPPSQHSLLHHV